jgi:hypothetical protein
MWPTRGDRDSGQAQASRKAFNVDDLNELETQSNDFLHWQVKVPALHPLPWLLLKTLFLTLKFFSVQFFLSPSLANELADNQITPYAHRSCHYSVTFLRAKARLLKRSETEAGRRLWKGIHFLCLFKMHTWQSARWLREALDITDVGLSARPPWWGHVNFSNWLNSSCLLQAEWRQQFLLGKEPGKTCKSIY